MDAEERLRVALAQKVWRDLHETGYADIFDDGIAELGREVGRSCARCHCGLRGSEPLERPRLHAGDV